MILEELIKEEEEIRVAVQRAYQDPTGRDEPVFDGVVDPVEYLKAPKRILWILKEPWEEGDDARGGWSITQNLLKEQTEKMAKTRAFQPIIYVTFGIFNKIWKWSEMNYIRDLPEMSSVLHQIAYINASKLPGGKTSNRSAILRAYKLSRSVILQQIKAYDPNYILGCEPHISQIMTDLGVPAEEIINRGSVSYAQVGNSMILNVYHPSRPPMTREKYIDDILSVIASP